MWCCSALVPGWRPKGSKPSTWRLGRIYSGRPQTCNCQTPPCAARNPRLVYGRITGWGQEGPLARSAGHDIDYIALSGVLHAIGRPGVPPVPPINLVADFGGGGMLLAYGVVCALLEASRSGRGQVVDAAMVDGCASLMGLTMMLRHLGLWNDQRGTNMLDGGAPFYDAYEKPAQLGDASQRERGGRPRTVGPRRRRGRPAACRGRAELTCGAGRTRS